MPGRTFTAILGLRLLFAGLALFVIGLASLPATAAIPQQPAQVVEQFHTSLLKAMKEANRLGLNGRFEQLSHAVDTAFDLTTMSRVAATRRYWDAADQTQKDRLVAAFGRFSAATYAAQFDSYSGQHFETLGERPGPQNTILVATRLVDPGGDDVGFTYVVRETDDGTWKIADVLLDDSISQLAVRRSEYRSILDASGLAGLIDVLETKASALLNQA